MLQGVGPPEAPRTCGFFEQGTTFPYTGPMRSLCSEFPCDNPSLHYGATWVLLATTGAPAFEAPIEAPSNPLEASEAAAVACTPMEEELAESPIRYDEEPVTVAAPVAEVRESGIFLANAAEAPEDLAAPQEADEPQEVTQPIVLAEAVTEAVISEPEVAAAAAEDVPDDVNAFCMLLETVAVQFGGESAAEVVSSWLRDEDSPMAEERAPWLALLRGDECDLSTASAATLDEWASKMVSKASGRDAAEIRRELRNRGLAAYGLLAA